MNKKAHNPARKLDNEAHERFVREYIACLDGGKAYKLVKKDVTDKSARNMASKLLARGDVRGRIEHLQRQYAAKIDVKGQDIMRAWAAMGFSNLTEFYRMNPSGRLEVKSLDELTPLQQYAIEEIEVTDHKDGAQSIKLKLANKQKALDSLARHLGMFKDEGAAPTQVTMIMEGFQPKRSLTYDDKGK